MILSCRPKALGNHGRLALFSAVLGFLTLPVAAQSHYTPYTVSTWAGSSPVGSADGVGSDARFNNPSGVAVDSAGNLYVADTANDTIRQVTPDGVVTTLAGLASVEGSANGTNSAARFGLLQGVAVDSAGNLYVADTDNCTIRKVTPMGTNWVVTTLAGRAGSAGTNDGTRSQARFNRPVGLAADSAGNVYVADAYNSTIRKVTPAGVVTTLAGLAGSSDSADGTNSAARFNGPEGVAVDNAGNLYVGDAHNATIRKVTPVGTNWVVTTLAGLAGSSGTNDGTGSDARFNNPSGVALDSAGNLYVTDTYSDTIRKVTPLGTNWVVTTLAGLAGSSGTSDGTGSTARFSLPQGVAVDNAGNVYVADAFNNNIREVNSAAVVNTLAGPVGAGQGSVDGTDSTARFNQPQGVAVDSAGKVYVADTGNSTIRRINPAGVVSTLAGLALNIGTNDGVGSDARFCYPAGVAVDSAGNVYVADQFNSTIRKVTPAGVVTTLAGLARSWGSADGTNSDARFHWPSGVAVDSAGNVYVADEWNNTIRKVTPDGVVTTLAGLAGNSGTNDGTGSDARFSYPAGVAVDSAGNLYVADQFNFTIRKVTPAGAVTTLAGLPGIAGITDGAGRAARFCYPSGVAVDGADNVYVADTFNDTLRKVTPTATNWVVTTLAGWAGSADMGDGTGSAARFNSPFGVAVDSAGNLYVADTINNTIRKGVLASYSPAQPVAYTPPPSNGQLRVTLLPLEANGQWRFPWELGWRNSGTLATNLAKDSYTIEFRQVPGYLAIPPTLTHLLVTNGGPTSIATNVYYPTLIPLSTNDTTGSLTVRMGPNPPTGAGWRFLGDSTPFLAPDSSTNLLPGTYLVEFAPISGYSKPANQAVAVFAGLPTVLSESYSFASSPPAGVLLPMPVTNTASEPYGFNGQLQSDVRFGSGVAVQTNVVLTAAHLVFNDQTLSYVSQAWWYWQKQAGVYEPQPLPARGWYVLSGYASQRATDLRTGLYGPDQSTPQSRNMDVAAVYFLWPVAGGGYGGYLPSDAVPNLWLTGYSQKMLVGYPVDGSLFGDASITNGVMYQTQPQPYPLSLATDPVAHQQVYTADWFLSYMGNSGGPLYVQFNGSYYAAAVYLGTLYNGAQPYASAVRAFDSNVVNLITLAATQGDNGTNNTGGGVITIIPSLAVSASHPGAIEFILGPPAALQAGAAWQFQGQTGYLWTSGTFQPVTSTNALTVQFKPIPGWNLPPGQTVEVLPDQTVTNIAFYSVANPVLVVTEGVGLGITGTTGTAYRLETRSSLNSGTWLPLSTNVLGPGTNRLLAWPPANGPAAFYRAVWLP